MQERKNRINSVCQWIGLAIAVPLLGAGLCLAVQAQTIADRDERHELFGAAAVFPFAAIVLYLLARVVGWVVAELANRKGSE